MVKKKSEERVKSTTKKKTIEVEQPELTTETVEIYICPNCEQEYEIEEMVNIGLGLRQFDNTTDDDWYDIEESSMLCQNCAESIFGYQGRVGKILEHEERLEILKKLKHKKRIRTFIYYFTDAHLWRTLIALAIIIVLLVYLLFQFFFWIFPL